MSNNNDDDDNNNDNNNNDDDDNSNDYDDKDNKSSSSRSNDNGDDEDNSSKNNNNNNNDDNDDDWKAQCLMFTQFTDCATNSPHHTCLCGNMIESHTTRQCIYLYFTGSGLLSKMTNNQTNILIHYFQFTDFICSVVVLFGA